MNYKYETSEEYEEQRKKEWQFAFKKTERQINNAIKEQQKGLLKYEMELEELEKGE
jgi:hypothetical protein